MLFAFIASGSFTASRADMHSREENPVEAKSTPKTKAKNSKYSKLKLWTKTQIAKIFPNFAFFV